MQHTMVAILLFLGVLYLVCVQVVVLKIVEIILYIQICVHVFLFFTLRYIMSFFLYHTVIRKQF